MPQIEFDQALDTTWAEFHADLTRNLVAMGTGESLLLESHHDTLDGRARVPASLRLSCQPGPTLRCEIPDNRHLHPLRALTEAQSARLRALGVQRPSLLEDLAVSPAGPAPRAYGPDAGQPNERGEFGQRAHHLDVDRDEVGRLADLALIVLREFWQIADPSFLRANFDTLAAAPSSPPAGDAPEDHAVLLPRLIEHTLTRRAGHTPSVDDYGDYLVPCGAQTVQVRALPEDGYVEVFGSVLCDVPERPETATTVAVLNDSWPYGRLLLVEGSLLAVLRVDAEPLLPPHLLRAIEHVAVLVAEAAHFAEHLGGAPAEALDPAPTEALPLSLDDHDLIAQKLPLMSLLLAGDPDVLFDAHDAAEMVAGDLTSLAECVAVAEELGRRWQECPGHPPRAGVGGLSEHIARTFGWPAVAEQLRAGLHLMTRPPVHEAQQLTLFDD